MYNLPPIPAVLTLLAFLGLCLNAAGDDETAKRADKQYNLDKSGLAIQGYDPVAYFPEGGGQAIPGKENITVTVGITTYRFASEAHRDLFKTNPEKYEPAYGGWCAYAMGAKGEKVEINPKAYIITDGQLFLFYKTFVTDTRKSWEKESATLKPRADASWKQIVATDDKAKS